MQPFTPLALGCFCRGFPFVIEPKTSNHQIDLLRDRFSLAIPKNCHSFSSQFLSISDRRETRCVFNAHFAIIFKLNNMKRRRDRRNITRLNQWMKSCAQLCWRLAPLLLLLPFLPFQSSIQLCLTWGAPVHKNMTSKHTFF